MPRAHYYAVAQDPEGNAIANAVVRLLQPGTTNVIAAPIYDSDTTLTAMTNPFTTTTGQISVYLDTPQRVDIGIAPPSAAERIIADIDIGASGGGGGGDSTHVGAGTASTKVGLSANSDGGNSVALGQTADSDGSYGVALGYAASAAGTDSTAVGGSANASANRGTSLGRSSMASAADATSVGANSAASNTNATAVGASAVANSDKSTAIGKSATGGHVHATAVGAEAATTEANQIILGTSADFADAPGGYVLTAVDGKRARLRVLPDGALTTTWHIPTTATNLLPTTEQTFESGIGSWAAVSGLSAAVQSTDYALAGTNSLKMTLSGAGAASARSSKVAATVGTVYVGQARMFYHVGAFTAGLNGTCWLEFYTAGNALIGTATVGLSRLFFADAWVFFDVRAVAPATTATVCLRVGLPTGGGANGNVFYADSCGIFAVPGTV